MKTINKKIIVTLTTLIMTISLFNCGGQGSSDSLEIRNNYFVSLNRLSLEEGSETNQDVLDLVGDAIDAFEQIYTVSDKEIYIELREYSFYSEDLKKNVSGLNYNYGDSCKIMVGVDPDSECETVQIIWHELYHCVNDISEHGDWVYEIFEMVDKYEEEGKCQG